MSPAPFVELFTLSLVHSAALFLHHYEVTNKWLLLILHTLITFYLVINNTGLRVINNTEYLSWRFLVWEITGLSSRSLKAVPMNLFQYFLESMLDRSLNIKVPSILQITTDPKWLHVSIIPYFQRYHEFVKTLNVPKLSTVCISIWYYCFPS